MKRLLAVALLLVLATAACASNATSTGTGAASGKSSFPPASFAEVAGATDAPVVTKPPARASATLASTPTSVPTYVRTPSAAPTGVPGALFVLQRYENDLIGAHYQSAWSLLAPAYQASLSGETAFAEERAEFMATAGKSYTAVANPTDIMSLEDWIKGQPYAVGIDQKDAVLVKVTWTSMVSSNSGWEVWVVNPTFSGWELYQVR